MTDNDEYHRMMWQSIDYQCNKIYPNTLMSSIILFTDDSKYTAFCEGEEYECIESQLIAEAWGLA